MQSRKWKVIIHPSVPVARLFSSNYTKQYVEQASASGDRAIVWYNLSNDADDATNIYAAREREMRPTTIIFTPRATSPIPGWGTVAV